MKKDLIFFGEDGKLTSTSANHIANLAKEFIQTKESIVNNIDFVNSNVTIIGSNNYNVLTEGISPDTLSDICAMLKDIADAKSLIAWLREGIKAKDNLVKEIRGIDTETWAICSNLDYPEAPEKEHVLTEDEYIANLTVKERNRYYELETLCAVYGKYIHPDGYYANARKNLNNKLQHPHSISGSGRDALLYTYTPSVSIENVDEEFFNMQNIHRAYQAELNGIKYKMEEAITLDEQTKTTKYAEDYENYRNAIAALNAKLSAWKVAETKKVQEMNIIIPNSLMEIYNTIKSLGKEK